MSIKNILVPFASAVSGPHVLEMAIGVANRFSAHIMALHVRPDPTALIPYIVGPMPSDMLVQISENAEKQGHERAAKAHEQFKKICLKFGVTETKAKGRATAVWKESLGNIDFAYGFEARLCDLAIVAQPSAVSPDSLTDILESVLFRSGRPVLMIPAKAEAAPGKRIVIAWNGSLEATRALAASLPLLEAAEEVIILTIGEAVIDGPDGEALKKYLVWHGIKASCVVVKSAAHGEGAAILAKAHEHKADMIVMGAYTHSRLREFILGGVTQHVVEHSDIATLLLH
jgi:nucleotide-binding universal stress UspA family protein